MPGHQKTTQDPFHAPKYVKAGRELAVMLEASHCPAMWPKDLFIGQEMTVEQLMADDGKATVPFGRHKVRSENICFVCPAEHKNRVSGVHEDENRNRSVRWFCSEAPCKAKWIREGRM